MVIDEVVYLEHFGVKGMRWGVRKAEKGSSTKPAKAPKETKEEKRERKAKKFDTQAAAYQVRMRDLDVQISKAGWYKRGGLVKRREEFSKLNDRAIKDAEAKRKGKLTSNQKKVIIGASIAAGVVAAYGANSLIQSGEMNRSILKGRAFLNKNKGSVWKMNDKLADPNMDVNDIMRDVVPKINPGYGKIGTTVNCRRATFAYEMRRRGYDVAATRTTNSHGQNIAGVHNALSPGSEFLPTSRMGMMRKYATETSQKARGKHFRTPLKDTMDRLGDVGMTNTIERPSGRTIGGIEDGIFDSLSKLPNGARGELGVRWKMGGGHSIAWEVVKGRPVIFDAQTGKRMSTPAEFAKVYGAFSVDKAGYTRLDNLRLNEDFLMRWLKDAA